jgi:hypothetical protein
MTDQGPSATRTVLDVHGEPHEVRWELTPPRSWLGLWSGHIVLRSLPSPNRHFGSLWLEDIYTKRSWTRRGLAKKLREREEALLGFTDRTIFTDGKDAWPG